LRRGSSVLIGGAFERLFCPEGREFEPTSQSSKVQMPGGLPGGGMLNFRIDRRIYFPVLSRKGYKKPQELKGPKYMPHLLVVDIRISLLFEKNAMFCPGTTNSLL